MDANRPPRLPGSRPGTVLVPQGPLVRGPAFIIDSLIVSMVVGMALGGETPLTKLIVVSLAAEFLYFALLEGVLGTTLGKRIFSLRVVSARDGRPCGPLPAVVRTALRLIDNLLFSLPGIAAILTSPKRQRFGDRAAHTLVVAEVPERVFAAITGAGGAGAAGAMSPDEVFQRLNELMQNQPRTQAQPGTARPETVVTDQLPCPFCDAPMDQDEIVCRHCGHYVNQVTAHAEAEQRAPVPMLYADDRGYRFDALWRLVFAGDEQSLDAVCEAVATWSRADRLLAVHTFSEVVDRRPLAFLDFLTHDSDPAVCALARDARWRLGGE